MVLLVRSEAWLSPHDHVPPTWFTMLNFVALRQTIQAYMEIYSKIEPRLLKSVEIIENDRVQIRLGTCDFFLF